MQYVRSSLACLQAFLVPGGVVLPYAIAAILSVCFTFILRSLSSFVLMIDVA